MPPFVNNVEGNGQVSDLHSSNLSSGRRNSFLDRILQRSFERRVFLATYFIPDLVNWRLIIDLSIY